jgi:hypothetical protein
MKKMHHGVWCGGSQTSSLIEGTSAMSAAEQWGFSDDAQLEAVTRCSTTYLVSFTGTPPKLDIMKEW